MDVGITVRFYKSYIMVTHLLLLRATIHSLPTPQQLPDHQRQRSVAWQLRFSRLVPLNVLLAFINDTALAALSPVDVDKMPVFMAATSKSAVRVSQLHPQLVLRWRHSSGAEMTRVD